MPQIVASQMEQRRTQQIIHRVAGHYRVSPAQVTHIGVVGIFPFDYRAICPNHRGDVWCVIEEGDRPITPAFPVVLEATHHLVDNYSHTQSIILSGRCEECGHIMVAESVAGG